jgi:long-chain acyl-CoA synthetase
MQIEKTRKVPMLLNDIIQKHPAKKTAFIFKNQYTTYGEFRKKVNEWAMFLQSQGVQKGDRVGLFSKNSPDFVAAYFAVVKAGAVVVPFNFQLIAPEIAYIVKDTEMKILLTKNKLDVRSALLNLGWEKDLKQFTFEEMQPPAGATLTAYAMEENEPAAIIYTSGTTGRPKGAVLSQGNIVHNTQDYSAIVNMREDDIALCVLPMYHCFGWICTVCANLLIGATQVVQETYQFSDAMNLIKKYHINTMCGVPTMFQLFVKGAEASELAHFRFFVSGGAPLPRILYEAFAKKFGQHVQEGYGLSEATPVTTFNRAGKTKQGSIGLPIPHVKVQLQDMDGREVSVGEVGELCVQGPNVMLGYWNRSKETAWTLRNGWLHTEDLAYRDEEGAIFIVDRLKDMIISSGENVYPREIEEVLMAHPDIKEAAVIGIPDKLRGQAICAYIVPEDGGATDKRMIRKYLLSRIAAYKVPKEFVFCDQLPRNNTGKVLKKVLREKALDNLINRK